MAAPPPELFPGTGLTDEISVSVDIEERGAG